MHKIAAWDNVHMVELKPQKKKKKVVAQIGAEMIFSIVMSSNIYSNLLLLEFNLCKAEQPLRGIELQEIEEENMKSIEEIWLERTFR